MEIDVTQLQMGDEILYPIQSSIARAKVIRPVGPSKVQTRQHPLGRPFYKSVRVKVSMVERIYSYAPGRQWSKMEYVATEDYNVEKTVDLNWRNIWLIKRQEL